MKLEEGERLISVQPCNEENDVLPQRVTVKL